MVFDLGPVFEWQMGGAREPALAWPRLGSIRGPFSLARKQTWHQRQEFLDQGRVAKRNGTEPRRPQWAKKGAQIQGVRKDTSL